MWLPRNLTTKQMQRWARIRSMGKQRFALVWGLCVTGSVSLCLAAIIIAILVIVGIVPPFAGVLLFIAHALLVPSSTYRFGMYFWDMMEDAFQRNA